MIRFRIDQNLTGSMLLINTWGISHLKCTNFFLKMLTSNGLIRFYDAERATLLNRIRGGLAALVRHKYLASSHLVKLIKFAMDEIPGLATASQQDREDNKPQGLELVRTLKNELDQLLNLSKKKFERTNYEEALQVVKDLCLEEGKKRKTFTVQKSYGSVLRMQKEELIKSSEKHVSNISELAAISNDLQEAETI
ncbi:hypothetical protein K1719_015440 [Acacia pycnantha]|nr:hypothetical protein K1719_015440 [Acacia pycnantha]